MDPSFLLSKEEIQKKLDESLPLWSLQENSSHPYLSRSFTAKHFQAALDAINAIGVIAEKESHHPDLHLTSYRNVEITIYTHKLNGVTESDLTLASMIDAEVKVEYSPKWLKENPHAQSTSK